MDIQKKMGHVKTSESNDKKAFHLLNKKEMADLLSNYVRQRDTDKKAGGDLGTQLDLFEENRNLKKENSAKDQEIKKLKRLLDDAKKEEELIKSEVFMSQRNFDDDRQRLQSDYENLKKRVRNFHEIQEENKKLSRSLEELAHSNRLSQLENQNQDNDQIRKQSQRIQRLEQELWGLKNDASTLRHNLGDFENLRREFNLLKRKYNDLKQTHQNAQQCLRKSQDNDRKIYFMEEHLAEAQSQLEYSNKQINELVTYIRMQQSDLQEKDDYISSVNERISVLLEDLPGDTESIQTFDDLTENVRVSLQSLSHEIQKRTEMEKELESLKTENRKLKHENLELKENQKEIRDEIIDTMKCIVEKTRRELGLKNEENHQLLEEIEKCKKCIKSLECEADKKASRGDNVIEIDDEFNESVELDPYRRLSFDENENPESLNTQNSAGVEGKDPYRRLSFSDDSDQDSLTTHISADEDTTLKESEEKATMTEIQIGLEAHQNEEKKGELTEDILERDDMPQKVIPLLKHLLEESKHDTQCLREENEELHNRLINSQEMKDSVDNLKKENYELKKEIEILRNQLADIESITELIEQQRMNTAELEQQFSGMQKDLSERTISILEKEREAELRVISTKLSDEISRTQSLQLKYNEMQKEMEKLQSLEPQIVSLNEQLTTEITKTENLQTEYNKLMVELDKLKKIEAEHNEQVELKKSLEDDLKTAGEDKKKILEELQLKCNEVRDLQIFINDLSNKSKVPAQNFNAQKSQDIPKNVFSLMKYLKQIIEEVHKDEISLVKRNYDKLVKKLWDENATLRKVADKKWLEIEDLTQNGPVSLPRLCKKIMVYGIKELNFHELCFVHNHIYEALIKVTNEILPQDQHTHKHSIPEKIPVKIQKDMKNLKLVKEKKETFDDHDCECTCNNESAATFVPKSVGKSSGQKEKKKPNVSVKYF